MHARLQRAASALQGRTGQEQVTLVASEIYLAIDRVVQKRWGGQGGGLRVRERRGERERKGEK